MSSDTLLNADFAEPVWVVDDLLPCGLALLCGRPKMGKSFMALQIALAVASGNTFLGRTTKQGSVHYFALEDYDKRIKRRLTTQHWGQNLPVMFHFSLPEGLKAIINLILRERPLLIVVDTFARAVKATVRHDDVGSVTEALGPLQKTASQNECLVLVLDHLRKGLSGDDWTEDIMSSTGKPATADTILGLYRERGQRFGMLKTTGRDLSNDHAIPVRFDQDLCLWLPVGESAVQQSIGKSKVMKALVALGGRGSTTQIARQSGMHKGNVSRELAELLDEGKVEQLPKEGRETPYRIRG